MLRRVKETLLSLLFPPVCETCQTVLPLSSGAGVCKLCASEIKTLKAPHCTTCGRTVCQEGNTCAECQDKSFHFDAAYAVAAYEGKMKDILQAYKFKKLRSLRSFLTDILCRFSAEHFGSSNFDVVAAVPLDSKRALERGFNQSGLLSSGLSKKMGLPEASRALKRNASAAPQSLLGKMQRRENIKNAFRVTQNQTFRDKNVLLVDDIMTTGETASECARTLKEQGGARSVTVLACARGI